MHIFGLVLCGMPVLSLAMLLGGIAPESLVVLLIISLSTILCVAMLSVAVSVWSQHARAAVIRAYLVLLLLLVVPLAAFLFQPTSAWSWIAPIQLQFVAADPLFVFEEVLTGTSPIRAVEPWAVLAMLVRNQMIVSLAALISATLLVRRVHLRQSSKAQKKPRWRLDLFRGTIGNRPMLWKEIHAEPSAAKLGLLGYVAMTLLFVFVVGCTMYVFHSVTTSPWRTASSYWEYALPMGTFLSCGGLLLVGARAATSVTSEKERQCWDSLLGTPLEPSQIIVAKILGSLWAVRGLWLLLAIVWLPGAPLGSSFLMGIPVMAGSLLVIAMFVAALGVRISLKAKNSLRAMALTIGVGIFLGGGYLLCCVPMMVHSHGDGEIILAPCIPFLLVFPGIVAQEGTRSLAHETAVGPAYLLGMAGYATATVLLYLNSVAEFDVIAGRSHRSYGEAGRYDPVGMGQAVVAEPAAAVVEKTVADVEVIDE
jgi:ABC-type transport system involved in multi-copper enzyme maturation permease subunit